jgi:hypothetical protein
MSDTVDRLYNLRVSLARIAQKLKLETKSLPITGKGFRELNDMAKQDSGWNELAGLVCGEVEKVLKGYAALDRAYDALYESAQILDHL